MKRRILAVDDEPHMLKLLELFITEKTPYKITTTSNSLEVPELLEQTTYDVILTDLRMPGMDGMDILRMVNDQGRSEEVIMITAFGTLENATEALSLGVFDYITKPFKKEQIIAAIGRAMRRQEGKREAARMQEILGREPFDEASEAFMREYVHELSRRCGGDKGAMVDRSGIPFDRIAPFMADEDTHPD